MRSAPASALHPLPSDFLITSVAGSAGRSSHSQIVNSIKALQLSPLFHSFPGVPHTRGPGRVAHTGPSTLFVSSLDPVLPHCKPFPLDAGTEGVGGFPSTAPASYHGFICRSQNHAKLISSNNLSNLGSGLFQGTSLYMHYTLYDSQIVCVLDMGGRVNFLSTV